MITIATKHQPFPEEYTLPDFITGKERSILRNPLIIETLYKSKEIDSSRQARMNLFSSHGEREGEAPAAWLQEGATQAPVIEKWGSGLKRIYDECRSNGVKVEFEPIKSGFLVIFHRDLAIAKAETPQEDGGINGGINSLLAYVENNPGKKTADIGKGINVSTRTAERYIKKLRDDGKIEFRGSKKTGGYYKI